MFTSRIASSGFLARAFVRLGVVATLALVPVGDVAAQGVGALREDAAAIAANAAADRVLDLLIKASGGREVLDSIASEVATGDVIWVDAGRELRGTFESFGKDSPARHLVQQTLPQIGNMRQGYDGKTAWTSAGDGPVRTLEGRELATIALMARFRNYDFAGLFHERELIGVEEFNRRSAYRLHLRARDVAPLILWIDRQTHMLIGTSLAMQVGGREHQVVTRFSDFRQIDVAGKPFTTAFASEQRIGTTTVTLVFKSRTVNVDVADSRFDNPEAVPAAAVPGDPAPGNKTTPANAPVLPDLPGTLDPATLPVAPRS